MENDKQAMNFLKSAFPHLYEVEEARQRFEIDSGDVLDFLYHLKHVVGHGYGSVLVTVTEKQVSKLEGMIRTIKNQETSKVIKSNGRSKKNFLDSSS